MKNTQKKLSRGISVNWISIFVVITIFLIVFGFIYVLDSLENQKNVSKNIQAQVDSLKSNSVPTSEDSLYIEYYRELSDKTDDAINRILVIVGIIAGIVTLFSVLLAFKAPHDIDKRIDELKSELVSAKEAAEEAKYQAKIANALTGETLQNRIDELTWIIKKYPDRPEAYEYRGWNEYLKKDYDAAFSDYGMASKNGFGSLNVHFGLIYFKKGNYEKAIDCFNKAIDENPINSAAYLDRGLTYSIKGEVEKALSDFEVTISLNGFEAKAYLYRSDLYRKLAKKETDPEKKAIYNSNAKSDFENAHKLDPEDKEVTSRETHFK